MSRRQHERGSRFQVDIEASVRVAAVAFRDNDIETSVAAVVHLWWGSGLRGRRFEQLVRRAREITQERVSLGAVQRGNPGRREAMPYFVAVLHGLLDDDRTVSRDKVRPEFTQRRATVGGWPAAKAAPMSPSTFDLRQPHPLSLGERHAIFAYLRQRWPPNEGEWWHPYDACTGPDVLLLESAWFQRDVQPRAFTDQSGMNVDRFAWRLHEGTPRWDDDPPDPPLGRDQLLDLAESPLDVGWQETIWVQPSLGWLVYTGHDENTYFLGSRLVTAVKDLWPDWALHQWTNPFYERPPRVNAVRARLYVLATEKGGRRAPIATGYRAACWVEPIDPTIGGNDGIVTIEDADSIAPGSANVVRIRFLHPYLVGEKPQPGFTFEIREGARLVAKATVISTD